MEYTQSDVGILVWSLFS